MHSSPSPRKRTAERSRTGPNPVRDAYHARAREYADFAEGDLERVPGDRERLVAFSELVEPEAGPVADVGCGPGHIVALLCELGLDAIGYDLAPAMIGEARRRFPGRSFRIGDFRSLELPAASLAGLVARHSLIHLPPERFPTIFSEWARALALRAPVLVSFFAAASAETHGRSFDHAIVTAYELFPATVVTAMRSAGFGDFEVGTRRPLPGERALDHATILARRCSR